MIASVCVAVGHQVPEAVEESLRKEEMTRMQTEDLKSFIAQRYFVQNLQTNPHAGLRTWQSAYMGLWRVLADIRDGLARAMAHLRWERVGDAEVILARLEVEAYLESDPDDQPTSGETTSDEEDEDMQV